ncbi:MAG: CDP-alcohol phosphatidyltransferase family protein [Pseudomonadota bacterium]
MFDAQIRPLIDPPLNALGRVAARAGLTADSVTLAGLVLGLLAAAAIAGGAFTLALILILLSRIADGLDGAVARATKKTDFGGYLDITCDFLFYGAIPMAFVWFDPVANGAAGAWLLTSFYFNGATFLGYAILAEKRGIDDKQERGAKSLYFTGGLLEGAETIGFFVLLCLIPQWFAPLAALFGALCFFTAGSRVLLARQVFSDNDRKDIP